MKFKSPQKWSSLCPHKIMPDNLCIIQEELHNSHFKYLLHTKWTIHKTVEPCNLSILDKMITVELCINVHSYILY